MKKITRNSRRTVQETIKRKTYQGILSRRTINAAVRLFELAAHLGSLQKKDEAGATFAAEDSSLVSATKTLRPFQVERAPLAAA